LKVAELRDWAKFHRTFHVPAYLPVVLADEAEVSLTGKTKKADMVEAISAHLEQNATGKKSKK
jgi:hypothetical protein